jgi:hypothetical protein
MSGWFSKIPVATVRYVSELEVVANGDPLSDFPSTLYNIANAGNFLSTSAKLGTILFAVGAAAEVVEQNSYYDLGPDIHSKSANGFRAHELAHAACRVAFQISCVVTISSITGVSLASMTNIGHERLIPNLMRTAGTAGTVGTALANIFGITGNLNEIGNKYSGVANSVKNAAERDVELLLSKLNDSSAINLPADNSATELLIKQDIHPKYVYAIYNREYARALARSSRAIKVYDQVIILVAEALDKLNGVTAWQRVPAPDDAKLHYKSMLFAPTVVFNILHGTPLTDPDITDERKTYLEKMDTLSKDTSPVPNDFTQYYNFMESVKDYVENQDISTSSTAVYASA